MFRIVGALTAMGLGLAPAAADIIGQAVDAGSSASASTWAQLGGIGAAMTALAYVAKRFADGSIVARPINEVLEANAAREAGYKRMLDDANDREDAHRALLMGKQIGR